MHLYYSPTSPYARIVRVAILEKGLADRVVPHVVDPWADDPELMQMNPVVRVPVLVTDDGAALTESLLILHYLEQQWPQPALVPPERRAAMLARAGVAVGVVDAAVHTVLGRRVAGESFDTGTIGQRRSRAIGAALAQLEQDPPADGEVLDLAAIVTAVALDYLDLRFADRRWSASHPRLAAWREHLRERPSLAATMPPGR